MKYHLQNIGAVLLMALFLPYIITLLLNGRQGIHQEKTLPEREYQVLCQLLQEDYSWMEDETLRLMAVLYRTELMRTKEVPQIEDASWEIYDKTYTRMYEAVASTQGQVVQIDGAYRELPYHAVSAGVTREGTFLGEDYSYVQAVECPLDLESENYFQIYMLSEAEIGRTLGTEFQADNILLEKDESGYVTRVCSTKDIWQGEQFRTLLHLPSSCFSMEMLENAVRVTVKGSGHGFGISLYTADRMLKQGSSLEEIFQKFYKNAECITIP